MWLAIKNLKTNNLTILVCGALFVCAFSLMLFQVKIANRFILTGNEGVHVQLLYQIVKNRTVETPGKDGDKSYYNNKYYSNKPPGFSFGLTIPYLLFDNFVPNSEKLHILFTTKEYELENKKFSHLFNTFFFVKLSNIFFSSASVVCIFLILSTFKLSNTAIAFGVISSSLGTLFPAYCSLANSIPLSILLCLLSFLFYINFNLHQNNALLWMSSFFSSMYAIVVDYSNAFVLIPLILLLGIKIQTNKKFMLSIIVGFIPIAVLLVYNHMVFENPFILTYSHYEPPTYVNWVDVKSSMTLSNMPNGLIGLLLSPGRGLLIISPITLLGFLTIRKTIKNKKDDLLLLTTMACSGILLISLYSLWHGGHCIGYRHILPSAVLLGILVGYYYDNAGKNAKKIALYLLIVSSFTGVMSFFIQIDSDLLSLTWKLEPEDIHANFYTELLLPYIFMHW